jgi:hypothetical protein
MNRDFLCRDAYRFGAAPAIALAELDPDTAQLNRTYLECISQHSLRALPEIDEWCGAQVRVFLRHDNVFVFAIAFQSLIGMANSVVLRNARFCVDEAGREQTNAKCGPLKNRTTVHAWIEGTLEQVSNQALHAASDSYAVTYRPDQNEHFVLLDTGLPVFAATDAFMVPGRCKVWARHVVSTIPEKVRP